ncbi:uncharacterized protein [Fopius arisanus]|uniref:Methyltransferase type 12 domain-containing protein n=1 Tax=Fopius arisanus TaxID=64838 RepID=A0A9R1TYL6_9HYME|nr:PREDICTED: uncharacterized protein LOC105262657 [Fopius arisanus]
MWLQYRDAVEILEEFDDKFKSMKGKIVDIGCGPGKVSKDLLLPKIGENASVIGIDISPAMLKYAKVYCANEERITFTQLNIETPDLPDNLIGQFDHATAFYCLNWCRNMKVTMENIYNLLKPGGRTIALLNLHHNIFDFYLEQQRDPSFSVYMKDALKYIPPHYGCGNPEKKFRAQLEGAGFNVLHCSARSKVFTFQTMDHQLDFLWAVNPFLDRMPEDVKKRYRKDVEKRLRKKLQRITNENSDGYVNIDDYYAILVAVFEKPQVERSVDSDAHI